MVASRVTLTLRTLVAAASLGPYCVSSHDSSLSCEQMVVDAYMTVLARQPLTAELSDNVTLCQHKQHWPPSPGARWNAALQGRTWNPAGMVYLMRNSDEPAYVDPFHEKGGCGHCSLRSPSPYCDTEVMPPNDDVLLHCVINARAKACCHLPPSVWGRNLLIFLFVTGTLYVGGGLAYNIKYRGRGMSKESLPNYEAWVQLYGLTLDGWAFTRMRVKRSKAAYLTRKLLGIKGGGGYKPIPGQATRTSAAASSNGSVTTAASGNASPASGSTAKGKTPAAAQEESDEDMFGRDTSSSSDSDSDDSILE